MKEFWSSLPKPFFVLAPLEGVTDTVFRQIVASAARPDVFFTEFTSCDGFCSEGKEVVEQNFVFTPQELPLVAQIWGKNPEFYYETTKAIATRGFSGIDINMGCPVRNVLKDGCGAAMIDTPEVAKDVIAAAKQGIKDAGADIPLSVKTRIGNRKISTEFWISFLLSQDIDALTVHGRTAKEQSKVPAHWDEITKAVKIRDTMGIRTAIIGNGDVANRQDGLKKAQESGVDGLMIGRGIFTDLWAFDRSQQHYIPQKDELLAIMKRHIELFRSTWGDKKNFAILKKFFKIYIHGFPNASDIREDLMRIDTYEEVLRFVAMLQI